MDKAEILKAVGEGMQAALKDLESRITAAAIDPLRSELTASLAQLKDEITELKGKQEELAASKVTSTEEKKEEKTTQAASLSAEDIAGAVAKAMGDTVNHLTSAIDDLKASMAEKEEQRGFRKSLSAAHFDVLHKYGGVDSEDEEPSPQNYQRAIEMVQTDIRLSREAKSKLLSELGAAKRMLIRSSAGGVQ